MKSILQNGIGIVLLLGVGIVICVGIARNLDKPTPIREHGRIVAFETPDGRIERGDPKFEELVSSYK